MLQVIDERGFASVSDLSVTFGVSDVTIRADLDLLDQQQSIQRVHGGAIVRNRALEREPSFEQALEASAAEKQLIGSLAASIVRPGQSIALDVGSTALAVAQALVARTELSDVVIVTNGLSIALALEEAIPRFTVIVTGGTLRPLQHSLVEPLASSMLRGLHVDLAFIGCNGVDAEHGVTNVNLPEAQLKQLMLESATRAVIVADGSKLGQVHLGRVGTIDRFAALITGPQSAPQAPDAPTTALAHAGLPIITDAGAAASFAG